MKESQHADHAVIKIRITCNANEDPPGIYTLGDRWRTRTDNDKKKRLPL